MFGPAMAWVAPGARWRPACLPQNRSTKPERNGLFYGNPTQFLVQLLTLGIVIVFAFTVTYGISKLLARFVGLRVTDNEEEVGLDISEHGEKAYA